MGGEVCEILNSAEGVGKIREEVNEHPDLRLQIPGYEVTEQVARGGQGVVYRGVQCATRREVAVKVMLGAAFTSEARRRRFAREVELAAALRHPNLVTVFDSGITPDGQRFVAMEFVRGVPIDQHVREHWADPPTSIRARTRALLRLMLGVASGVAHAHAAGVIHRDLKPSNIIVETDGTPRVVDFGIARPLVMPDGVSLTHEFVGTPAYAAPEQFEGDGSRVGTRTDVYALGLILYRLLTGRMPYPCDGGFMDIARNARETPPIPLSRFVKKIPADVEAIVLTCLSKEPERRYSSAGELAADLEDFLDGRAVRARRDSVLYVLKRLASRHRLVAITAALLLITVVGAAVGFAGLAGDLDRARRATEESLALSEVQRARLLSAGGDVSRTEAILWSQVARAGSPGVAQRRSLRAEWALRELYAKTGILMSARIDAIPFAVGFGAGESIWVVDATGARIDWSAEGELLGRTPRPAITGAPFSACANTTGDVVAVSSGTELCLQRLTSEGIQTLMTDVTREWASTNLRLSNDGRFLVQWRWSGPAACATRTPTSSFS